MGCLHEDLNQASKATQNHFASGMIPTHNTDILVDTINAYQGNSAGSNNIQSKMHPINRERTNCGNSEDTALQTKYLHEVLSFGDLTWMEHVACLVELCEENSPYSKSQ